MAGQDYVRIEGLDELRRTIRKIGDDELKNGLKNAHKSAAEMVADEAASRAPVKSGNLASSIRALGSQKFGRVKGGRAKVPYFGWIDFGGTIRQQHRQITRPYIREGRILYPSLAAKKAQIADAYLAEIVRIFKDYGYRTR